MEVVVAYGEPTGADVVTPLAIDSVIVGTSDGSSASIVASGPGARSAWGLSDLDEIEQAVVG